MPVQKLIQIGSRILNLDAVRYMEINGSNLVNVHLTEGQELQYIDLEAQALLAVLDAGYVKKIGVSSDSLRTSEELIDAIGRPNE